MRRATLLARGRCSSVRAMSEKKPTKLWGGAFTQAENDPFFDEMNSSIGYDKALWAADLRGSEAYAAALHRAGVINDTQAEAMASGLAQVSHGSSVIIFQRCARSGRAASSKSHKTSRVF